MGKLGTYTASYVWTGTGESCFHLYITVPAFLEAPEYSLIPLCTRDGSNTFQGEIVSKAQRGESQAHWKHLAWEALESSHEAKLLWVTTLVSTILPFLAPPQFYKVR